MTEENYWYSSLAPRLEDEAVAEAKIIVDAFRGRGIPIEIGGFPDRAEEDDDLHPGGIAFMYAKGHILVREQYLGGEGGRTESNAFRTPSSKEAYWTYSGKPTGSRKSRSGESSGTSCSST